MRSTLPLFIVTLLAASTVARPASAAMMQHSDLASLAYESDVIVMARRESSPSVDEAHVHHVITKVYDGALLKVGDAVDVDYGSYSMSNYVTDDRGRAEPSSTVVLFLKRYDPNKPQLSLVLSGLRIERDGAVQRFEQWNNPGGFVPVPQGRDPGDIWGDPAAIRTTTWGDFEVDLTRAITRARDVRAALPAATTAEGRARLVAVVPDARGASGEAFLVPGFAEDGIMRVVLDRLGEVGDVDAALQVLERGHAPWAWREGKLDDEAWCTVARDAKRTAPQRITAVRHLQRTWAPNKKCIADTAQELLVHSDPALRRAAASLAGRLVQNAQAARLKPVLTKQLAVEKDAYARMEIFFALGSPAGAVTTPLFAAEVSGNHVNAIVAWATNEQPWSVHLTATAEGRAALPVTTATGSGRTSASFTTPLRFDPPLSPGPHAVTLVAKLERDGRVVTQNVDLGTWNPTLPPAPSDVDAGSSAANAEGAAPTKSDAAGTAPAHAPRSPRCGCATTRAPFTPLAALPALTAAAAVATMRRARRRCVTSRLWRSESRS